jgi:hypothetical protein
MFGERTGAMDSRLALETADDRTLAGRAADGDIRAFEILVRRYGPLMRGFATRILGSNDETDDVVQDAFIVAWQQLPTLDDPSVVKSWLMRIVSRKSIDRVRARRPHADIADHDPASAEAATPERQAGRASRRSPGRSPGCRSSNAGAGCCARSRSTVTTTSPGSCTCPPRPSAACWRGLVRP